VWRGRGWLWGMLGVLVVVASGVFYWLADKPEAPAVRISRSFAATGVKKVVLRGGTADAAELATVPDAEVVKVSGAPVGGARGYHSPDPNWRETPAAEWGLDFVSARYGEVLVISTKNEIRYIHHGYVLESVTLTVPAGVEVVRERRELNGDGEADLREPRP
jgi:hypothetical protein